MKLAARLTMEGLIRALRAKGHDIADAVEHRRRRPDAVQPRAARKPKRMTGGTDGVGRR